MKLDCLVFVFGFVIKKLIVNYLKCLFTLFLNRRLAVRAANLANGELFLKIKLIKPQSAKKLLLPKNFQRLFL